MTKAAALFEWFNQFLTAYPVSNVPEGAAFPYLTYELSTGAWGDEVAITVDLWYYATGEAEPTAKAEEIGRAIGRSGVIVPCDGGGIWIKRGSPWCQSLAAEDDPNLKRRSLNIDLEFLTED